MTSGKVGRARRHRRKYMEKKSKGLCVYHGCDKKAEETVYCKKHHDYHLLKSHKYYNKKVVRNGY